MPKTTGRIVVLIALVATGACGGGSGGSPAAPSPATLAVPSNFRITQQKVDLTANEVQLSWTGTGPGYRVTAGSTAGASDMLSVEVTATSYTWLAPRAQNLHFVRVVATRGSETSGPSADLPVFTIDLRHVIDALFFRSGPMADSPSLALGNPQAGVWASGTRLRVLISPEAGETARANMQTFADDYAQVVGGSITATTEVTGDDYRTATLASVPPFTILTRVLSGGCGAGAVIACAFYGPVPLGQNKSIVTQNGAAGSVASAHEMGHAYGMGHVHVNSSVRAELNFLMNPALLSNQMTEPEKNAIRGALEGGIRGGTTRDQALAAGLVLPFTASAFGSAAGFAASASSSRAPSRCKIVN